METPVQDQAITQHMDKIIGEGVKKERTCIVNQKCAGNPEGDEPMNINCRQVDQQFIEKINRDRYDNQRPGKLSIRGYGQFLEEY